MVDDDVDLEPTLGYEHVRGSDECEISEDAESSLGSFDRMIDQEKSYRTYDRNPDIYGWSGGPITSWTIAIMSRRSTIINPTLAMAGALKETALIRTPARTKQNDQHSN